MLPHSPISRRQFIAALVPGWLTRQNLKQASTAVVAIGITCVLVSFLRQRHPLSLLKGAGIMIGGLVVIYCLVRALEMAQTLLRRSPLMVQAVATVVLRLLPPSAVAVMTIYVYGRWERGEDITDLWITLGVAVLGMVRHEISMRRQERDSRLQHTGDSQLTQD